MMYFWVGVLELIGAFFAASAMARIWLFGFHRPAGTLYCCIMAGYAMYAIRLLVQS